MTRKTSDNAATPQPTRSPNTRSLPVAGKLPGAGVRRDLKETWGNIKSKNEGEQVESNNAEARLLKITRLSPNPNQPRRTLDAGRDAELAADVKERGILEPIIVRISGEDDEGSLYQIVAGERRYRAALAVGLSRVPVIVKNYNDTEARFTALVENLQRLDLDPLDEAYYYRTLSQDYNYSYREIGKMVNRSPAYISERLKRLPGSQNNPLLTDNDTPVDEEKDTEQTGNNSDKNHKHSESEQKLQNSQSEAAFVKPVYRFRDYISKTRERLVKMKDAERELLAAEIQELKKQLSQLEEEIANPAVSRETHRKTTRQ